MIGVFNTFRNRIFGLTAAVLMSLVAICQQPLATPERTPEQEADKLTEVMKRTLTLTEEQEPTVYQINLKYAKLRRNVKDRTEAMQNRQKKNEELKQVLTQRQYELLLMHHQQNRQKMNTRPEAIRVVPQP